MSRGRKRQAENSPVVWNITVPFDLAREVEKVLIEQGGIGQVPYGSRAALVGSLLTEWLMLHKHRVDKSVEV